MRYKVFHAIKPTFGVPGLPQPKFPEEFEKVAEVEALSKEQVFAKTNNIDTPWTKNEGVNAVREKIRSTSVGDVIEDETGKKFITDMIGWKEIV